MPLQVMSSYKYLGMLLHEHLNYNVSVKVVRYYSVLVVPLVQLFQKVQPKYHLMFFVKLVELIV